MPIYDPFGINGGGTTAAAPKNYTGGSTKSNAGRVYDPFNINSIQAVPNPSASPKPATTTQAQSNASKSTSIFGKVKSAVTNVGNAAKAAVRPAIDVASGQGGKAAHDTAQLASDVSGDTVNQFTKAAVNTPLAISREVQNKPITDIQKNVFGTTDQGSIAKKIVGSTVGTGSMFVGGGEAAGARSLLSTGAKLAGKKIAKDAAIGAVGNASATVTANPNANIKEVGKSAAVGGLFGGIAPIAAKGVGRITSKVADSIPIGSTTDAKDLVRNQRTQTLLDAAKKPEIVPKVDQNKVAAGIVRPEVSSTPRSDLVISATDVHKPDAQKVNQYVKQIKDGEPIEPVITHTVNGQKFVIDGQQKLAAAEKLGIDHVPTVEKVPGARVDVPPGEAPVAEKPVASVAPVEKSISNAPIEKPVVEPLATIPDRGTSKVASSVQEKAVARGLKNDFGEAGGYDKVTIADQSAKAVKVANDRPLLDQIISGEKPLPDGLRATALIKAVEEHPELSKDVPLLNRLSQAEHLTGESSRSAQELRLAAERSPHSPVEAIRSIRKAREAAITRRTGKSVAQAQDSELKAIRAAKSTVPKPTKETFTSFVESLKC